MVDISSLKPINTIKCHGPIKRYSKSGIRNRSSGRFYLVYTSFVLRSNGAFFPHFVGTKRNLPLLHLSTESTILPPGPKLSIQRGYFYLESKTVDTELLDSVAASA